MFEFFERLTRNNFFTKFSFHDLNQPYWAGKSFLQVHIQLSDWQLSKKLLSNNYRVQKAPTGIKKLEGDGRQKSGRKDDI